MPENRELSQPMQKRLQALQARHANVCRRLEETCRHPGSTDHEMRRLKSEKLRIKDEMEELRRAS